MINNKTKAFLDFLPKKTILFANQWIEEGDFTIKIEKPRKGKLGDFRTPFKSQPSRITINSDLNPYLFFFIFTHEYAHYLVWKKYKRTKAHGKQWKLIFTGLLLQTASCYPPFLEKVILNFAKAPKATLSASPELFKAFRTLRTENTLVLLESVQFNEQFQLNDKIFIRKEKRRTRFICVNTKNKRKYLVSALAEVEVLPKQTRLKLF